MASLHDLLSRGYFPKELPPTFVTDGFASAVLAAWSAAPTSFTDIKKLRGRPCLHNFARVGTLRRRLSIPNPVLHFNLAKAVADNWALLDSHIRKSAFTQSYPVIGKP